MNTQAEQQNVAGTLPFASANLKGFRSTLKAPKGVHAQRMVAHAVDRIVQEGDSKRAQALAQLLPAERDFVIAVVEEFYAWAAQREAASQAQ